jgi:hypothetical protein
MYAAAYLSTIFMDGGSAAASIAIGTRLREEYHSMLCIGGF